MQPSGSVARWDKRATTPDFLGAWARAFIRSARSPRHGSESISPPFASSINGTVALSARRAGAAERFYPAIAHLAKVTGTPVKIMLPKDQELAQLQIKPETITKFNVGAKKDGHIVAIDHEVYVSSAISISACMPTVRATPPTRWNSTLPTFRTGVHWCAYRPTRRAPAPPAATPAGNQVVLGEHDRRDGGDARP